MVWNGCGGRVQGFLSIVWRNECGFEQATRSDPQIVLCIDEATSEQKLELSSLGALFCGAN